MKWFYIIVEITLALQYEQENSDLKKACFAKQLDIPSTHEESTFEAVEYFNLQGMKYKCSHLNSLNDSLASEIGYFSKVAGYSSTILKLITCTNFKIPSILERHLGLQIAPMLEFFVKLVTS